MEELKNRILQDGKVINNEILKVDSFINHQIDVELLNNISNFLASHFENVNKILTIETSGIAFAIGVAQQLGNIPVVFAKKSKSALTDNNVYSAEVKSFTRKINSTVIVDKRFLKEGENILFVDDFLAEGNAALGLLDICNQAKCNVLGLAVVIEKSFQGGREKLEEAGVKVISAASIGNFENNTPIFD